MQKNSFSPVGPERDAKKASSRLLKKLKKHAKEYLQKRLKGALLNILKTEENYTENYKIMANLKFTINR